MSEIIIQSMDQRVYFWKGKRFQAHAFGYDYIWQASDTVYFDIAGKPYLLCEPVRKIPGHKKGYLRGKKIFPPSYLPRRFDHQF